MDKKVLKWYEAPAVEIVELEVEGQILAGSSVDPGESILPDPDENMED
jgi:hypothetical protein